MDLFAVPLNQFCVACFDRMRKVQQVLSTQLFIICMLKHFCLLFLFFLCVYALLTFPISFIYVGAKIVEKKQNEKFFLLSHIISTLISIGSHSEFTFHVPICWEMFLLGDRRKEWDEIHRKDEMVKAQI